MKFASNVCCHDAVWLEVDRDRHEDGDIPDMAILEISKISQPRAILDNSQGFRRNSHVLLLEPA